MVENFGKIRHISKCSLPPWPNRQARAKAEAAQSFAARKKALQEVPQQKLGENKTTWLNIGKIYEKYMKIWEKEHDNPMDGMRGQYSQARLSWMFIVFFWTCTCRSATLGVYWVCIDVLISILLFFVGGTYSGCFTPLLTCFSLSKHAIDTG